MEKGFNVGDRVVVEEVTGGNVDYAFGIVNHATRSSVITVQFYKDTVKRRDGDGGSSTVTCTCDFKEELPINLKYRWLPSLSCMGRASEGALMWTEVKHFNEDEEYTSHTYY